MHSAETDWQGSVTRHPLAGCLCLVPESACPWFASALSASAPHTAESRAPGSACAEPSSRGHDRDYRTALGCRTLQPSQCHSTGVWKQRLPTELIFPADRHRHHSYSSVQVMV